MRVVAAVPASFSEQESDEQSTPRYNTRRARGGMVLIFSV